jgi:hypothetical protein
MALILSLTAADGATSTVTLPDPVVSAPSTGMQAVIQPATGAAVTFDRAQGIDQGSYVDPQGQFTQGCILVTNAALPGFRVYFRSDTNGLRDEVVFERADVWATAPTNMGAYTATIVKNGVTIGTLSVPHHDWGTVTRWQSAPRPVRTTIAALVAAKLLPAFDSTKLLNPPTTPGATHTPMGFAGLTPNMPNTGERGDIGVVTEWQADYICTGANLPTVLAQAEAMGSWPIAFRDTHTGAPMDAIAYPYASVEWNQGVQLIAMPGGTAGAYDVGHSPAGSYLPFLLTGDPYYLERLQMQVQADMLCAPWPARWKQGGRYLAWPLRNALEAAAVTPASVPSWLLPQSRMQAVVAALLTGVQSATSDLWANFGIFGNLPDFKFAFWQNDMLLAVCALGVMLGHTEWQPTLQRLITCAQARTNNAVGWKSSLACLYDSLSAGIASLAVAVGATDTTITVDPTIQTAASPWFPSTATPESVFPAAPFPIVIDSEQMTVTSVNAATHVWQVTRTQSTTHNAGRVFVGSNVTTWPALLALVLAEQQISTGDGVNIAFNRPLDVTYPSYLRGALALCDQISATSGASTWITAQVAGSPYASDRKWMFAA